MTGEAGVAKKIKLTRPELKRYRDALDRYERYLPMLKLKQQQLQMTQRDVACKRDEVEKSVHDATLEFRRYESVLAEPAGVPVRKLAEPVQVRTSRTNIAGVNIPVFEDADFSPPAYSLFGTPPWVDRTLFDLREINRLRARLDVLQQQYDLLTRELTRIVQRVNLFEKIKIPEAVEAIRVIRIKLGDEMTAGVGRAKIAKSKLADARDAQASTGETEPVAGHVNGNGTGGEARTP
ncbi:MAG TPA: V-type ATP synthase subunit D [Phycisphaerae bacterium]|nr:V-type ATP synthase subunit D [Phycisphaerae bacterium]